MTTLKKMILPKKMLDDINAMAAIISGILSKNAICDPNYVAADVDMCSTGDLTLSMAQYFPTTWSIYSDPSQYSELDHRLRGETTPISRSDQSSVSNGKRASFDMTNAVLQRNRIELACNSIYDGENLKLPFLNSSIDLIFVSQKIKTLLPTQMCSSIMTNLVDPTSINSLSHLIEEGYRCLRTDAGVLVIYGTLSPELSEVQLGDSSWIQIPDMPQIQEGWLEIKRELGLSKSSSLKHEKEILTKNIMTMKCTPFGKHQLSSSWRSRSYSRFTHYFDTAQLTLPEFYLELKSLPQYQFFVRPMNDPETVGCHRHHDNNVVESFCLFLQYNKIKRVRLRRTHRLFLLSSSRSLIHHELLFMKDDETSVFDATKSSAHSFNQIESHIHLLGREKK